MTNLFLIVAEQSLRLSGMILFLWVLRTLIRRIPGSALYLLWILVFVGLVLPFRVEVPYHTEAPATAAEAVLSTEEPDCPGGASGRSESAGFPRSGGERTKSARSGRSPAAGGRCLGSSFGDFGVYQRVEAGRVFPEAARRPADRAGRL